MVKGLLGLGWCIAVFAAYHLNNTAYFTLKISDFGGFLLGLAK